MGLGGCIILIAVGAILTFATDFELEGINVTLVGAILMLVGVIGTIAFTSIARHAAAAHDADAAGRGGRPHARRPPHLRTAVR